MKFVVLLIIIASTIETYAEDQNFRIVDGHETTIKNHPHQLQIALSANHSGWCGASLLSSTVAITAAHCVARTKSYKIGVKAGITSLSKDKGVFAPVETVIVHPKFNNHIFNDIALLRLATPLVTSTNIKPIPLADHKAKLTGSEYVIGWGSSDVLKQAHLSLSEKCLRQIPNAICTKVSMTTKSDAACFGDSSGPVISSGTLIGITSVVLPLNIEIDRELPGCEGVYTDVRQFRDWIKQEVGL